MSDARRLRLEVVLQAVDKATRPLRSLLKTNDDLARSIKATRDRLKQLDTQNANIESWRKFKGELKANSQALADTASKANDLQRKLKELNAVPAQKKTLDAQVRAKEKELDWARKNLADQMSLRTHYNPALVDKYASEVSKLTGQLGQLKKESAALSDLEKTSKQKLTKEFEAAVKKTKQLKEEQAQLRNNLSGVRKRMDEAGISTIGLAKHQAALRKSVKDANETLEQQKAQLKAVADRQRKLAGAQAQYQRSMATRNAMLGNGASLVAAGAVTLSPAAKTVKDYVAFEDAMLGIARQVDGARDAGGKLTPVYYDMARQIKQLGADLPIPVTQIAEMVTAGARMEVPRHELIDYTRTVAMMATAFDAVPDEIAESMGKVAKNFRIPTNAIMGLADTINYLDDNAISKGNDIIDVLNRTSGVVSTVAMSAKDAAALGSTLLTLGERTETAGTAINAIIQKFAAADKGTKKFRSAVEEIGLTSAQVQRGMATDATGTLFRVIEAIKRLPEDKRIGVMVELVGLEHSDTLAKLVDKPDELQRQIGLANGNQAQGSMSREFSARQDTISAHWQRLQNRIFNTSSESGGGLRATIMDLIDSTGRLLERFDTFAKNNPGLVSGLLKAAAAAGAVLLAAGGLTLSMAAMQGPLVIARYGLRLLTIRAGGLSGGLKLLKAGIGKVGTALKWIGRLALANPILATIAVIATAAFLIWDNWETLGPKIEGLWQSIKGTCSSAWDGIKNTWNEFWRDMDALGNDGTVNVNATLLKWSPITPIKAVFVAVWDYFVPEQFQQFGSNIIQGIIDGLFSRFPALKDAVGKIAAWFKEVFGANSAAMPAVANVTQMEASLPGPAKAGATKLAAVGAGVAIATAPAMAAPVSFDTRPAMALHSAGDAAAPAPITINIHPPAGADPQAIARLVRDELRQIENQRAARQRSRLADRD
jgi:TP901 family phage tail tape measure protein